MHNFLRITKHALRCCAKSALFWFVLLALLGEVVAAFFVPYSSPKITSAIERRNPLFRRGWPQYTNAQIDPLGDIIVISNSQGFGREVLASSVYSTHLDTLLFGHSQGGFRVHNWSAPGAIFQDFMILTTKAVAANPDVLFIITHSQNFQEAHFERPAAFSALDVVLSLGELNLVRHLPETFLQQYVRLEGFLQNTAFLRSSTLRARLFFQDWSSKHAPSMSHFLMGNAVSSQETYWWNFPEGGPGTRLTLAELAPSQIQKRIFAEYSSDAIRLFASLFQSHSDTEVFVILMPLAETILSSRSIEITGEFNQELKDVFRNSPITVVDLTQSLDPMHFYSHTHFDGVNHARFAQRLHELLLERELH